MKDLWQIYSSTHPYILSFIVVIRFLHFIQTTCMIRKTYTHMYKRLNHGIWKTYLLFIIRIQRRQAMRAVFIQGGKKNKKYKHKLSILLCFRFAVYLRVYVFRSCLCVVTSLAYDRWTKNIYLLLSQCRHVYAYKILYFCSKERCHKLYKVWYFFSAVFVLLYFIKILHNKGEIHIFILWSFSFICIVVSFPVLGMD